MRRTAGLTMALIFTLLSIGAHASPILIQSSEILVSASDGTGSSAGDLYFDTDFGSRSILEPDGDSSARLDTNWLETDGGQGALLDFDVEHVRNGASNGFASYSAKINFFALVSSSYSLSGLYSASDLSSASILISEVKLVDLTNNWVLFHDKNWSLNTLNESFTVGVGDEGDFINEFEGIASSHVIAGREYELTITNTISANFVADDGASATGCLTFALYSGFTSQDTSGAGSCGISSVPEPVPLTLLSAGLVVLGLRGRKVLAN